MRHTLGMFIDPGQDDAKGFAIVDGRDVNRKGPIGHVIDSKLVEQRHQFGVAMISRADLLDGFLARRGMKPSVAIIQNPAFRINRRGLDLQGELITLDPFASGEKPDRGQSAKDQGDAPSGVKR